MMMMNKWSSSFIAIRNANEWPKQIREIDFKNLYIRRQT
jgi:hypothetical protein